MTEGPGPAPPTPARVRGSPLHDLGKRKKRKETLFTECPEPSFESQLLKLLLGRYSCHLMTWEAKNQRN